MSATALTSDGRLIVVTEHALERLAERCPAATLTASVLIRREVEAALREGRIACRKPRPLVPFGCRRRRAHPRTGRFAWTPSFDRVYLLRPTKRGRLRGWFVVTVFTPTSDPFAAGEER